MKTNPNIEDKIILNEFKPRPYQVPLFEAIEQKGIKRAVLVWHRRCLSGSSHITMSDGSYKLLKDIVPGDEILSWNGQGFEKDTVKHAWSTGIKDTVKVSSGSASVITSHDHVFASTYTGTDVVRWYPIRDLHPRRQLMGYSGLPCDGVNNPDLAEFFGYMLADGYVAHYQQPKFTNTNLTILKRVEELATKLFDIRPIWRPKGNGFDLGLSNGTKGGGTFKNPVKELFRISGCAVQNSVQRLPKWIWQVNKESLLRFFAGQISADGNIYVRKNRNQHVRIPGKTYPPNVEITIHCGASYEYAHDIYWLLRKLGILPHKPFLERGSNWRIRIARTENVKLLLSTRIFGKEEARAKAIEALKDTTSVRGIFKGCYVSGYKKEESAPEELYDIETEKNHNFLANGLLVHNSGKDFACVQLIIRQALKKVGSYYYLLPTHKQARLVIFDGMTMDGKRFLDYIPKRLIKQVHIQEMRVSLINGSNIYFLGSDNFDALRGSNPQGIVFSEYAYQHPATYPTLRPILVANDGWAVFISTPNGSSNSFYNLYEVAKVSPEWYCDVQTIEDTGVVSVESIEKERQEGLMSEDMIQQEYYVRFDIGSVGAYYAKYLNRLELNGQIGDVLWEPAFPVYTAWDLGMRDSTFIIFYQIIGRSIHIIDTYQNDSKGLEHYVDVIGSKPYKYAKHFAPHDIMVREFASGMTRLDKAKNLGLKFQSKTDHRNIRSSAIPNVSLMDGIEAVRTTLPRMWIDKTRCKDLIRAIRDYRRDYDSKLKVYKNHPRHDNNSHAADSLRYLCLSLPMCQAATTPQELEKRYQKAMKGSEGSLPDVFTKG